MGKHLVADAICLIFVFCLLHAPVYAGWHSEILDNGEFYHMSSSLVLDSNDEPHLSYVQNPSEDLIYLHREGISWIYMDVHTTGDVIRLHALTLDADNHPYIVFADTTTEQMFCAHWDGNTWDKSLVANHCIPGSHRSITLDATGYPHICAWDSVSTSLVHAWWDGAAWQTEIVDPTPNTGSSSSIAMDSENHIYISYRLSYPENDLKLAYHDGATWQLETVDSAGDVGRDCWLALDTKEHPHIAYLDFDPNYDLKYAYRDGSNWVIQTVYSPGRTGYNPTLALDHLDRPHIGFRQYQAENLVYAFWNGFQWIIETADEGGGYEASIALDSREQPHCTFSDINNLRYAWKTVVWERLQMSGTEFQAGDLFKLDRRCGNGEDTDVAVDEFLILDVYGSYWYWPTWSEDVDFQTWTLETGQEYSDTILEFSWPAGSGSAPGLKFWAAFLNAGTANLICYDVVEWSYNAP